MSTVHSRIHFSLDDDQQRVAVFVLDDPSEHGMAVTFDLDYGEFTISGTPNALMNTALIFFDAVTEAVNKLGPECSFCGQQGLNLGEFAQPYKAGFAHKGCATDAEDALAEARGR